MHFYKNGNYIVCMMDDGTKIRKTDEDSFEPEFPECCDCCITKKCSQNCIFCYEGCTPQGKHGNIMSYKFLDTLHPYTELAINGNDMDHPQLLEFLNKLKEKKVYANVTVNQNQFMNNYDLICDLINKKLIYGLGVSFSHYDKKFIDRVKEFPNAVIHVINGVIKLSDLKMIRGLGLKILILGYKDIRRGNTYLNNNQAKVRANKMYLYTYLPEIVKDNWFKAVSFDNLAIGQLEVKRLMTEEQWSEFYMGDDGNFTFYVDLVEGKFAKNSCVLEKRYDIGDKSIDEMFNIIKNEK